MTSNKCLMLAQHFVQGTTLKLTCYSLEKQPLSRCLNLEHLGLSEMLGGGGEGIGFKGLPEILNYQKAVYQLPFASYQTTVAS